jgi:hypothetical protein
MHTRSQNKPKKFKQTSARKLIEIVFWDRKGVLVMEFMQQGTTVLRNTENISYGHSEEKAWNADIPHTAAETREVVERFNREQSDYSPYSPALAPSDYHLITYMKNWLGSQHFNSNEELMEGVRTWLSSHAGGFFDTCIHKLITQ